MGFGKTKVQDGTVRELGDTIDESNVDLIVQQAIKKYFEMGNIVDAMFWRECLSLLQKKYRFKLQRAK